MDDLFIIINDAGIIECVSPSVVDVFGYSLVELSGQPMSRILRLPGEADQDIPEAHWRHASLSPVLEGIHRTGRRFPLRLTENEVQGAGQSHYVLYLQDPKDHKHNPGIFSRHRELYELATRQGRISVWEVDYRTNHLEFSTAQAEMLGLKEIPTSLEAWKAIFHPDDWLELERQTELLLRRQISEINVECRMFGANGAQFWTLVRGMAYFDTDGRPIKSIGTSIDISDRKKAQEERDLFFTLSLDFLCIADTQGYFRRINPALSKTLGYTEEELTSAPFFSFVHPDDLALTEGALAGLISGKNVVAFVNRYRCKDGGWRWLSWTCPAPRHGSDMIYAIARDVTEQKQNEAALQKAMQEAEKANRAKSEFLSRMSHELRTPLNAILGFGQLLKRELTGKQQEQSDIIVKGGRHLLGLINEVLEISRIEAGRLDISAESVDLTELVNEVVSLSHPLAEQRGIKIIVDQPALRERHVRADKQRLKPIPFN